ncbi:leucyl/phenylalanyl-tRNA--protein transferase [Kiritimatiellaeota bacterium B1221]|nr:leucyl/phenylalanyl-tRNA--protein transferase [Kiritimatiellaeota bacterium B1221]
MSTIRKPSVEDFKVFFGTRLKHLSSQQELIWLSDQVPTEALAAAYPMGIFPWPGEDPNLFPWVSPRQRGVLPLNQFHLGKSTRRQIRKAEFKVTYNKAFTQIIQSCHQAHEAESWIHPLMQQAYIQAHQAGFAHSVEVWQNEKLVGGLYGIDSGLFFSGESMFHKVPNAGKAAIQFLVEKRAARGNSLLDIQQLTPHMKAMGAEVWSRERFLKETSKGKK